jgi:hypothetical protein
MKLQKAHILPILLILQITIVKTLAQFPEFIEQWYSKGLYPKIAFLSRNLLGWIPFSVGDLIYFILIVSLLRWIWKNNFKLAFNSIFHFSFFMGNELL